MPVFKDAGGREWVVSIDVNALRRVRDRLGLNLTDLVGGETLDRVTKDPVLLVDILYVLCESAAKAADVDAEAFASELRGDALDAAVTAMLESLADFFPSRRGRLLRQIIERGRRIEDRLLAEAERKTANGEVDPETARETSGQPSGDSPASPASTPAP